MPFSLQISAAQNRVYLNAGTLMLNINDDDYEAGLKNINKANKWPDERLIRDDRVPDAMDNDANVSNPIDSDLNIPEPNILDVKIQGSNSSLLSSNIWKVIRIIYTLLISFINSVIEWLFLYICDAILIDY